MAPSPMATRAKVREITPTAGYVIKGTSMNPHRPGKLFMNICSHKIVGRPVNASNQPVSEDHLDSKGLESLRVPQFAGLPRAIDAGAVIDVLYDPSLVTRACGNAPTQELSEYFRKRITELAVPFAHADTNGTFSLDPRSIKFLQNCTYKGGLGPKGSEPVPIPLEVDPAEPVATPLIEELKPSAKTTQPKSVAKSAGKSKSGAKKPVVKKGFFDRMKPGEELYGPDGSDEGVVPDGAGDPLGYPQSR